jgi:hypothetical protein
MRPFTVLIGIILGSAASTTFGLGTVLIVFAVLSFGGKHPDLAREVPRLLLSLVTFGILTAASASSFLGQVRARSWRGWAHLATVLSLSIVVLLYWPRRN